MIKEAKSRLAIQAFNHIGRAIGSRSSINLDKILTKARRKTGLNDLGNDFNADAFKILINSINDEAQLNPFGNLMMEEKLIGQLESRLWATKWFNKYPEILEQEVLPIMLITGLQRTGTTKVQRLLSALPDARPLYSWEALYPAPIKSIDETRKRKARTKRNEKAVKWISPIFHSIHPLFYDEPEEDVLLLDVHFMSSSSEAIMNVPTYADWLGNQDQSEAYKYEKKLLKLLQWQQEGKYWVLKSPHHLEYLDTYIQVFPDTRIVWMHRNPRECIPSFLSMLYYSRSIFSDKVNQDEIKNHWLKKLSKMVANGLNFRKEHANEIIDISFTSLLNSEIKVLEQLARHSLINLDDFNKHPAALNKTYVSKHKYQLSDWGLTDNDISSRFLFYDDHINKMNTQA